MACSGKGQAAEFTPAPAMSLDWEVRLSEPSLLFGDEENRLEDFESGRVIPFERRFVALCFSVMVVAMQVEQGAVTVKKTARGVD